METRRQQPLDATHVVRRAQARKAARQLTQPPGLVVLQTFVVALQELLVQAA